MKVATTLLTVGVASALDNGLGRTPAMGYNSWYDLMCTSSMNETTIVEVAAKMKSLNLFSLGYEYVNLDDCWSRGRDSKGAIMSDSVTFPSGIKSLAGHVHTLGMKFGLYTDRGVKTCAGRPGSGGNEALDAQTFSDWGVDYVKEDSCNASGNHTVAFQEYGAMRDGLNKTGRPIYFSLCGWNNWYAPVGNTLGNSWRIDSDDNNWGLIMKNINSLARLAQYAGPGGWNDPCLLRSADHTGKRDISTLQTRMQFSIWSMAAAPLLISGSILHMNQTDLETYSNAKVIAIDQDVLGKAGIRIAGDDIPASPTNVWGRILSNGDFALMFFNVGSTSSDVTCDSACFGKLKVANIGGSTCHELWSTSVMTISKDESVSVTLPANGGHAMYRCTPSK
eukprot:TRINITY_DN13041_c3_g1_i1.p1 TRINITY_DN13041_c3_g1~~TRINITY_DN13041_c3_g1_i1.p1  ORF type:complete len:407 (+),score=72.64 TRINITY_DN13041_c3_g1_i1:45-1223(+)